MKKNLFALLGLACFAWAAWSLFRWLFFSPAVIGNYPGWKWLLSIAIETGLGFWFFSLSNDDSPAKN